MKILTYVRPRKILVSTTNVIHIHKKIVQHSNTHDACISQTVEKNQATECQYYRILPLQEPDPIRFAVILCMNVL